MYQQIRLGYDLCAIYAENPSSQYGQHSRQPLTSVGNIRDYLDNVTGFNGLRRSQAAAKYILDRSNSAKETQVAMYSILPFHLGGYALKTPSLNAFAALSPEGCRLTGHQSLMCDLIWPEDKVIAEYDSNLTHLSADQHRTDKSRATALALSGYQLFSITADNLRSFDRLEATFSALRKMLNMRSRDPELNKYRKKRLELFSFFHTW
ncbi:MAG: hypothetical protein IJ106_13195 [Parasporobacterium sp.]|nr:hypothetical protein [Parasporobacterium sp.]